MTTTVKKTTTPTTTTGDTRGKSTAFEEKKADKDNKKEEIHEREPDGEKRRGDREKRAEGGVARQRRDRSKKRLGDAVHNGEIHTEVRPNDRRQLLAEDEGLGAELPAGRDGHGGAGGVQGAAASVHEVGGGLPPRILRLQQAQPFLPHPILLVGRRPHQPVLQAPHDPRRQQARSRGRP
eukprot:CAMPEP_0174252284 /NCGR_PEP_ID=MMETSP0439-20130205/1822_1 /TAXON_ID=0 /ORGANISM="Stereomyxa ramosa, Strain Chinc5" /LENGTH=179 /DNA_ID=CAMNT_0015332799 /DNA_START=334 /DNA_END=874 /DNA_ORIENTATION=+